MHCTTCCAVDGIYLHANVGSDMCTNQTRTHWLTTPTEVIYLRLPVPHTGAEARDSLHKMIVCQHGVPRQCYRPTLLRVAFSFCSLM